MTYKKKSIKETISDIEASKMYLPALQRKFVWGKPQIELLFDSIMKNIPVGTFLYWKLKPENAKEYVFYEFLKEYDEQHPYNTRKEGLFLNPEITGVLDGQQRLSSMYIGLQGIHKSKTPNKHKANEKSYPVTRLYLNVLSLPYSISDDNKIKVLDDLNFEFRFLTDKDSKEWTSRKVRKIGEDGLEIIIEETMYWMRVGEVLGWIEDNEFDLIVQDFIEKAKSENQRVAIAKNRRLIKKALETLNSRISKEELIYYFEIINDDLEAILKIFIRVNSGGTQLSKTDLLFSTIVATWDDGRERIEELLQTINRKGDGFNFTNEYLMRCCLVLTDAPVLYKVNSFKSDNVQRIKSNWEKIAKAIKETVDLMVDYGFSGSLLTSLNATIIIAYYLYKEGKVNDSTKIDIKKYLIHSLINGIYGSGNDQLISTLRNTFRKNVGDDPGHYILKSNLFSFEELLKVNLPARKSLYITEDELENMMESKKGTQSFFVLSLLYPHLKYKEIQFHQDHIHPASRFNKDTFRQFDLSLEESNTWIMMRDMIPNLQLMEGRENESKNASEFLPWLSKKNESYQANFKVSNYIPQGESLEFRNFKSFFEKRKSSLKQELRDVLAITSVLKVEKDDLSEEESEVEEIEIS